MSARAYDPAALRGGSAVEWWTVAWMVLEAAASLGAGVAAGSVALLAFGGDSLIELLSAGVLLHRLHLEQAGRRAGEVRGAERRASGAVAALLFLLAIAVAGGALRDLLTHHAPRTSPAGLAIAAASALVMPWIVAVKRRVAARIGSSALKADAACGMVCASMAVTLLAGLALRAAFGWWWADPVASLGLVCFIVREGREAAGAALGRAAPCDCC